MPRYFFHVHDDMIVEDEEGRELPDEAIARENAVEEAQILICESIRRHGSVNMDHSIVVADEDGAELFAVMFREAFQILG